MQQGPSPQELNQKRKVQPKNIGPNTWSSGFFECWKDPVNCIFVWYCCPCAVCANGTYLLDKDPWATRDDVLKTLAKGACLYLSMCFVWGNCLAISYVYGQFKTVEHMYGIVEEPKPDQPPPETKDKCMKLWMNICCCYCSTCRISRELKSRRSLARTMIPGFGVAPAAVEMGTVPKNSV